MQPKRGAAKVKPTQRMFYRREKSEAEKNTRKHMEKKARHTRDTMRRKCTIRIMAIINNKATVNMI
jgi:hypothetical protein